VAGAEMKLQASHSGWRKISLYNIYAWIIYIAGSSVWGEGVVAFFSVAGECLDV